MYCIVQRYVLHNLSIVLIAGVRPMYVAGVLTVAVALPNAVQGWN